MVAHFLVVTFVISLYLSPVATTNGLQTRWLFYSPHSLIDCSYNPCHNGGTCIDHQHSNDECHCAKGWTGATCDFPIICYFNPCHNGGTCIDHRSSNGECHCAKGWTGATCDAPIDCRINPCHNGGSCTDHTHSNDECHCAKGWTGSTCDIEECLHNPCKNGGTCVIDAGVYKCNCVTGLTGEHCDTFNDPCLFLKPCQHGGTCSYMQEKIDCSCTSGWKDGQCQTDIDECATSNPCQHGGTCINAPGNYNCHCLSGWTGDHCEIDINECLPNNSLCHNSGVCVNTNGSFTCNCSSDWTGQLCEDAIPTCNHTCCLDAVILSKSVNSSKATTCPGTDQYTSNDALPIACCNITSHGNWRKGTTVQKSGVCIDGRIPPYTPIASYNGPTLTNDSAGVFYGCIKNGSPGFMMIRQVCNASPQLVNIDSSSTIGQDSFVVIY